MPCNGSLQDREFGKFRPSPADDKCAVAVVPHPDPAYPQNVNILGPTNAIAHNIPLVIDTEYEFSPGSLTKRITLKARGRAKILLAFQSGETSTNFFTIDMGQPFEAVIGPGFQSFYLRLKNHSDIVEVIEWY